MICDIFIELDCACLSGCCNRHSSSCTTGPSYTCCYNRSSATTSRPNYTSGYNCFVEKMYRRSHKKVLNGWGSTPEPAGWRSLQRSPRPPSWILVLRARPPVHNFLHPPLIATYPPSLLEPMIMKARLQVLTALLLFTTGLAKPPVWNQYQPNITLRCCHGNGRHMGPCAYSGGYRGGGKPGLCPPPPPN